MHMTISKALRKVAHAYFDFSHFILRLFLLRMSTALAVGEAMGMYGPESEDWMLKEERMLKEIKARKAAEAAQREAETVAALSRKAWSETT